jgi:hypothetical protein
MRNPGNQPSCIAWRVSENEPVMIAWLAMMVATVASSTSGKIAQPGASLKKGLPPRSGLSRRSAVWPA